MAFVNQWLANQGISPIPVVEETISLILLSGVSLCMAVKDNPKPTEGNSTSIEMIGNSEGKL